VCYGCGSENIWCDRESLFTNVTCEPGDTVSECGFTPVDAIVMVNSGVALFPTSPELEAGATGELPQPTVRHGMVGMTNTVASARDPDTVGRTDFLDRPGTFW